MSAITDRFKSQLTQPVREPARPEEVKPVPLTSVSEWSEDARKDGVTVQHFGPDTPAPKPDALGRLPGDQLSPEQVAGERAKVALHAQRQAVGDAS